MPQQKDSPYTNSQGVDRQYPLSQKPVKGKTWYDQQTPEQKTLLDTLVQHYMEGIKRAGPQFDGELPHVPRPSSYQPDPLVIGGPGFSRMMRHMIDLSPAVKERVGTITRGPNEEYIDELRASNMNPVDNGVGTSLLGTTGVMKNPMPVSIQGVQDYDPDKGASREFLTGAHELAHVAGYGEQGAYKTQDLLQKYNPATKDIVDTRHANDKAAGISHDGILNALLDRFGR